jgi:hypothetical protein
MTFETKPLVFKTKSVAPHRLTRGPADQRKGEEYRMDRSNVNLKSTRRKRKKNGNRKAPKTARYKEDAKLSARAVSIDYRMV